MCSSTGIVLKWAGVDENSFRERTITTWIQYYSITIQYEQKKINLFTHMTLCSEIHFTFMSVSQNKNGGR
ncbi:MAG: hypothetical protein R3A12_10615 [Ignavibacteria bacterium]